MRRHRPLGGEATEDTHGVNVVAQEGHGDDFIRRLVKRVEGKGQVEKYLVF